MCQYGRGGYSIFIIIIILRFLSLNLCFFFSLFLSFTSFLLSPSLYFRFHFFFPTFTFSHFITHPTKIYPRSFCLLFLSLKLLVFFLCSLSLTLTFSLLYTSLCFCFYFLILYFFSLSYIYPSVSLTLFSFLFSLYYVPAHTLYFITHPTKNSLHSFCVYSFLSLSLPHRRFAFFRCVFFFFFNNFTFAFSANGESDKQLRRKRKSTNQC